MKHTGWILLIFGMLWSCGPRLDRPEGAPEAISQKKLLQKIIEARGDFEKVRLRGKGSYQGGGGSQSFRFDLRIQRDSLIWLSISDPLLGIGIARGQMSPQRIAAYNSLDRTYFEGKPEQLQRFIDMDYEFGQLQGLLLAEIDPPDSKLQMGYQPGYYHLMDYDTSQQAAPARRDFQEWKVDPGHYKAQQHRLRQPILGRSFEFTYEDFQPQRPHLPRVIQWRSSPKKRELKLDIKRVDIDGDFDFPFQIPADYAPSS